MKYEKTDLCQLGWLSCMGCCISNIRTKGSDSCGNNFKSKLDIAKGIQKNTLEFHYHTQKGKPLVDFMNRSKDLRESGICRNLVYDTEKDKVFCPLHPEENRGVDLRKEHHHCDILHLCKTAFLFNHWDVPTKTKFVKFLKEKQKAGELDWHSYSVAMQNDSLLDEFEGLDWR